MKRLVQNRLFASFALISIAITYIYAMSIVDDPRMVDGALNFQEATWLELVLAIGSVILCVSLWLSALASSFGSGKKLWGFAILFIWPVCFIYSFMVNFIWGGNDQ